MVSPSSFDSLRRLGKIPFFFDEITSEPSPFDKTRTTICQKLQLRALF